MIALFLEKHFDSFFPSEYDTERTPTVNVTVSTGFSQDAFATNSEGSSSEFTVREGQVFGLKCETEPQFTANWLTSVGEGGQ